MKKDVLSCIDCYIETGFNKNSGSKFLQSVLNAYQNNEKLKIFLSHKMSGVDELEVKKFRKLYFEKVKSLFDGVKGLESQFFFRAVIRLIEENIKKENPLKVPEDIEYDMALNNIIPIEFELIDNYTHTDVPKDAGRLAHLGTSIIQMDKADLIVFCGKQKANGCKTEKYIVDLYDIPYITLKLGKSSEEENDNEE